MKCPECKKVDLKESISFAGMFIVKKVVTTYCPICGFQKKVILDSSIGERQNYNLSR